MKKLLLICTILGSTFPLHAQYYSFSQDTAVYANLTSQTVLSSAGWDYYNVYTVPFPFHFHYFGAQFDTFYVAGGFGGFVYYGQNQFGDYQISFYDASLIDRGGTGASTISYSVAGVAPNRILIIQVNNAGFENDVTELDYINAQLWFYETSNVIEIHIGPNSVLNSNSWDVASCPGPFVMLSENQNTLLELVGSSSHPTASTTASADCITGAPPVDLVYRFTPLSSGIDEINRSQLKVYPNPNQGQFTMKNDDLTRRAEVRLYNLTGQEVYFTYVEPEETKTVQTDLPEGMYVLKMTDGEHVYVGKMIVGSNK